MAARKNMVSIRGWPRIVKKITLRYCSETTLTWSSLPLHDSPPVPQMRLHLLKFFRRICNLPRPSRTEWPLCVCETLAAPHNILLSPQTPGRAQLPPNREDQVKACTEPTTDAYGQKKGPGTSIPPCSVAEFTNAAHDPVCICDALLSA